NGGCGAVAHFTCVNNVGGPATCNDVDECNLNTDNCDPAATCTNTVGSFTCKCPVGMAGDGVTCGCDLTGTFAIKTELDVTWDAVVILPPPFAPAIAAGSDTLFSYAIRKQTQTGTTLTTDTISCGGTSPDLCSPLLNKAFEQTIPDAIWGGPKMPVFHSTVTLGSTRPLDTFVGANEVALLGMTLTNPTGTWPTSNGDPSITWVDQDNDGPLGITSNVVHTGSSTKCGTPPLAFDYVADPSGGSKPIGTVYLGSRVLATYSGSIQSCNAISGTITGPGPNNFPLANGHVKGCLYSDGTPCSNSTISSLDSNATSSPQHIVGSHFSMVRVADSITCAGARATTFP
ncbi:MAG TPA: calcium-binding EGF-like domain-containing protein, partial [Polyangiaceae bacterium]